jgi:hypothetical protein
VSDAEIVRNARPFPFLAPFDTREIPSLASIVPKVFNPPFLTDPWVMTTFDELSGKKWPLKPAVEALFPILILTNPFQIDQMFSLMLVCIFASGFSELTEAIRYSFGFREYVKGDAHKQYAMSHMEGLCSHLGQLNYSDLRSRSLQLQTEYSTHVEDPLRTLRSLEIKLRHFSVLRFVRIASPLAESGS